MRLVTVELETERLRLRPLRQDDLDALARWAADPLVMRYMGRGPMRREETAAALEGWIAHWDEHGFGPWGAEEKASGTLIGRIGLSFHSEWPDDPEVGWKLDPAYWGRGFATEGGAASIQYGFADLGARRIVSLCEPENVASRRVMAKLGLRFLTEKMHRDLGVLLWVHAIDRSATSLSQGRDRTR